MVSTLASGAVSHCQVPLPAVCCAVGLQLRSLCDYPCVHYTALLCRETPLCFDNQRQRLQPCSPTRGPSFLPCHAVLVTVALSKCLNKDYESSCFIFSRTVFGFSESFESPYEFDVILLFISEEKKCQWDFCRNSMESVEFFELYWHLNNDEDRSLDKGRLCPIVYAVFHLSL